MKKDSYKMAIVLFAIGYIVYLRKSRKPKLSPIELKLYQESVEAMDDMNKILGV